MADTIKMGTTLIAESALMPESLRFESEPWTSFYTAGGIIRELRKASGKQSKYGSEGSVAHSDKVIDHYDHPRDCRQPSEGSPEWGHRPARRARVRRGDEGADEDQFRDASHRGSGVQDVRLRLGNCQLFARHRAGQGQDLEEALAIKNTNIVRELSLPACNPARCNKILQDWGEATPGGVALFFNGSSSENPAVRVVPGALPAAVATTI